MAKVTVVIPCRNYGKFIDEAVESILEQTFRDFEIIIINDSSDDSYTIEKLKNYDSKKAKVINTTSGHPSGARNCGIRESKSPYILTLDADDKFHNKFLEKSVPILDSKAKVGVVTCGLVAFGDNNYVAFPTSGGIKNALLGPPALSSSIFRKQCWIDVGGYNEVDFKDGAEDWDFWLSIIEKGWQFHLIQEYLYYYRKWSDSFTEIHRVKKINTHLKLYQQLIKNHRDSYEKYLDYVILEKEKEKLLEKEAFCKSKSYKIGQFILAPIVFFINLFKKEKYGKVC